MATRGKKKRTGVDSVDAQTFRLVGGLVLIAFGVLLFLSIIIRMNGVMFMGFRTVSYGLCGIFCFLLPVFPVWAGIELILSSHRQANIRSPLLAFVIFLLLLACANLFSYTSGNGRTLSLMDYFYGKATPAGDFMDMMRQAYAFSTQSMTPRAGGLLGVLPAWPLWKLMGPVPAGILCVLLALAAVPFMLRMNLRQLGEKLTHRKDEREKAAETFQQHQNQEEVQWQQQAARSAAQQAQQSAEYMQPEPRGRTRNPRPILRRDPPGVAGFPETPEETRLPARREPGRRLSFSRIFGVQEEAAAPARPHLAESGNTGAHPVQGTFVGPDGRLYQAVPVSQAQQSSLLTGHPLSAAASGPSVLPAPSMSGPFTPVSVTPPEAPHSFTVSGFGQDPETDGEEKTEETQDPGDLTAQVTAPAPERPGRKRTQSSPEMPEEEKPKAPPTLWQEQVARQLEEKEKKQEKEQEKEEDTEAPEMPLRPLSSWQGDQPRKDESGRVHQERLQLPPKIENAAWKPEVKIAPEKGGSRLFAQELEIESQEPESPPYVFPSIDFLKLPSGTGNFSPEEDRARAQRLEETLASFRVNAQVKHITHGPAISRFELELAAGIKVSKITDLGPNIAMNMAVKSVRIEAPIPGKSLVGVEVPNSKVTTVTLREVLESSEMHSAKGPLVVALGRDIAGKPVVCNLARMPHLLIAGATGSGKSVCINAIINSLIYRCSPDDVRLIMVDPKVVELQCYNGIPHLLVPVVSEPHKASGALQWAVDEMMRRYEVFQHAQVRNIDNYNENLNSGEKKMPRLVIIIDELADLMLTCKREVEEQICRIAQLARAAGIHLVVATQRPSVDVITGLIKANIPSRIAFKVSSFIDSRTILDKNGAEQLLGWGDMLYQPMGEFTPLRVQGCFLSDDEVNTVTDFIRAHSTPDYDPQVVEQLSRIENDSGMPAPDMAETVDDGSGDGDLLNQCIEMALQDGQVSTSLIQRRMKIGYARAGRLVDEMEKRGIISAKDGAKPRVCLITREEYEKMRDMSQDV